MPSTLEQRVSRAARPLAIRAYLFRLLAAALLPLLILSGGFGWSFAQAERERFFAQVNATAAMAAGAVDREVLGLIETLDTLASAPSLTEGDLAAFHTQASEVARLTGIPIILRDTRGLQVANTLVPWGEPLPTTSRLSAWDETVLRQQRPIVTGHYQGLHGGRDAFAVILPVVRHGQPIYLMHLSVPVSRLRDVLLTLALDQGWVLGVLDSRGVVMARSAAHDERVGRQSALLTALPQPGRPVSGRGISAMGRDAFFVARVASGSGFVVIAAADTALVEAPLRHTLWAALAISLALVCSSLMVAQIFGGRLARAVRGLAEIGGAMGRGERVAPQPSTIAEIDAVAQVLATAAEAREAHDLRQQLILNELDHRVKNTLATVQALTLLTAREAPDVGTYCDNMMHRLRSLSRTQDLLRGQGGVSADLRSLLLAELSLHESSGGGRVTLEGPDLPMPAPAAAALGMMCHELATNAAKYGALSVPGGRLLVTWTVLPAAYAEPRLGLVWQEANGPLVQPPARQGFGTQLIERGLARQLQAEVAFEYRPDGLRFRLEMPLPKPRVPLAPGVPAA